MPPLSEEFLPKNRKSSAADPVFPYRRGRPLTAVVRAGPLNDAKRRNLMLDKLFTPGHLAVLFAVVLFLFGGKKLPELGRGMGEALKGFRDGIKGLADKS
jgi:sec-independent protein translocase protein TatA